MNEVGAKLAVALIAVIMIVGVVVVSTPRSENLRPAEGSWDFTVSGCWAFCSQYRLNYSFPSAINTSSVGIYNLTFTVRSLQGTTESVQLQRINVTIRDGAGLVLHSTSFNSGVVLRTGQRWEPAGSNFTLSDITLGLQPGQTTNVRAGISVEFDEIAVVAGSHHGKKESISDIGIQVHNPSQEALGTPFALVVPWSIIVPLFLFGSLAWAVSGVFRNFSSIPRPGPYGWRDPGTGRFVSTGVAFVAILSALGGVLLWLLGVIGTPGHALSFGDMLLGEITNNVGISAPLSIIFFVIGTLLHWRG